MDVTTIMDYLSKYGFMFIFLIIFLEYLNLPGLAAGILMPLAGAWAYRTGNSLVIAIIVSIAAGVIASWILYFVGLYGGNFMIDKYVKRFPKHKPIIDKCIYKLKRHGNSGVFICRLLPAIRTIIAVPAGVLKLNFMQYTLWSALGILIWNSVLMTAGYYGLNIIMNKII